MRKILILIGNIFDIGWWADKINSKLGIYEWAKKSSFLFKAKIRYDKKRMELDGR